MILYLILSLGKKTSIYVTIYITLMISVSPLDFTLFTIPNVLTYIARDSTYCPRKCLTSHFFRNNDTRILAGAMVHREVRKWTMARFAQCFCERSVMAKPSSPDNAHCFSYCAIISESLSRAKAAGWREKNLSTPSPWNAIDATPWIPAAGHTSLIPCEKK